MNDSASNPQADLPPAPENSTGKTLKAARVSAKIDITKICADLRISPTVIQALENGEYQLLPGDPYIRALLGSVGRYLGLDPIALIQTYNHEIGAQQTAPSIAPYKDRAHTYTAAHKQIFIGVVAVLFVGLFLLIGKLNKGISNDSKNNSGVISGQVDSIPLAQDTTLETHSLLPDSMRINAPADSGEIRSKMGVSTTHLDSLRAKSKIASSGVPNSQNPNPEGAAKPSILPTTGAQSIPTAKPATALGAPLKTALAPEDTTFIKPLIDSVGVKILRAGKEDFLTILRLGKQMQISHSDTITVMISKRRSVEVTMGHKSVIPDKKRFRIYGTTLKAF